MPRICTVCTHPEREAIDSALLTPETKRGIARRFAVAEDSIGRHAANHLAQELSAGATVTRVTNVRAVAEADPVSDDSEVEEYDAATGTVRPVRMTPERSDLRAFGRR